MIKEYRDNFLGDSATYKLNKDIKHNPGIGFNIVGYSQTIQQNGLFLLNKCSTKFKGFKFVECFVEMLII